MLRRVLRRVSRRLDKGYLDTGRLDKCISLLMRMIDNSRGGAAGDMATKGTPVGTSLVALPFVGWDLGRGKGRRTWAGEQGQWQWQWQWQGTDKEASVSCVCKGSEAAERLAVVEIT